MGVVCVGECVRVGVCMSVFVLVHVCMTMCV